MTSNDDVTQWLEQLAAGDEQAAREIYERYWEHLLRIARKHLAAGSRRVADEEDVALSAFNSFCRGVENGRFEQLGDRDELWKLLVTITTRKAMAQMRRQKRLKRGGGGVRGESVFLQVNQSGQSVGINMVPGAIEEPQVFAIMSEQCDRLVQNLGDDVLRQIALLKMEGYTNEEIAGQLDCSLRTIKRRLAMIRSHWENELDE